MVNHLNNQSNASVVWYPFNKTTLEKAKNENKAIYLLIASPSAYWSQQMTQDIESNQVVSELLNERFISIKVNKDERPDIERYYQKVYTLMSRQNAGLPLNIFLTQELEPFYAGAYIAPHAIESQLGFEELLRVISKKYITDYATLSQKGQEVLQYIEPKEESIQATKLHLDIMKTISSQSQQLLDKEFGGFTKAPKFPNVTTLELLLDVYELNKEEALLKSVTLTLDQMSKGGFYDLEKGGFYLYAKDEKWEEAYELKTIYNNAMLSSLYLRAYQITANENYKKTALETIDFLLSQQSASKLFSLRGETSLCSWNALLTRTLFKAGSIDSKYTLKAIETLAAILSNFYVDGMLYHTNSSSKIKAFLEDYTQLGETLITAYQHTLDESFLILATQFSNLLIEQYYQQGRWIYTSNEFQLREDISDLTLPSSVASALSLLLSIASLVDLTYKKFVFKTLELHSYNLMRQPLSSPSLSKIMLRYLKDDLIIKANVDLLKEHIDKREELAYPYILFKNIEEHEFQLCNSHSCIITKRKFEDIISNLEHP